MHSFDTALALMKEEVRETLSASPPLAQEYMRHLLGAQGKFIRAQALLICSQDQEGGIPQDAVKLAGAIEIFHLATLVHDDIIDEADLRRGRDTLQHRYGAGTAVIIGDYLLSMAMKLAASIEDREKYEKIRLPNYVSRVCLGELEQHLSGGSPDLSVYRYLRIISGKTAALFEAAYYIGGLLGGADERELRKYKRLGKYVGMIFQLTDDCMDLEDTEEAARKPVQSDFENDVITLPLIRAFRLWPDLRERAMQRKLTGEEARSAARRSGGLEDTRRLARRYYDKTLAVMGEMALYDDKKAQLTELANRALRVL